MKMAGLVLLALGLAVRAPAQSPSPPATATAPRDNDAQLPAAAFATLPLIEGASLSPDGLHIAARVAVHGRQRLIVMPVAAGLAKARVFAVGDSVDVNWWRWVGNDWLAVGVGAQQSLYGIDVYVTRTIGVDAAMTKINRIDWLNSGLRADDVIWVARDGTTRILLSRQTGIEREDQFYPEVIEANLATGKVKRILPGRADVFTWYADGAGQVRMADRYDEANRKRELLYRANNGEPFRSIAVRRKQDGDDSITQPLIFRTDGTAIATDDADGYDAIYEVSLPDLKLGRKLLGAPGYDTNSVIATPGEDGLAGIRLEDKFSHIAWLDPELAGIQEAADKAVGDRRARIVSWNDAHTRLLLSVGSPSQAGALYFWDTAGDRMQRLTWNNEALQGRTLSPVSTVRYPARDGTTIEAIVTHPRHRAGQKNLPVIILPHGGPFARDSEEWDWWSQYLAEIGYLVIQPNYRGSSGYGTAFARLGEGQWGLKMQDDLDDALAWAAKEGIADPKRACMVGGSYGGYAAMRAAQRDGARYRCAVSYAGVSDLGAMRSYDSQFLYGKTYGEWLKKQAPDFRAVSPRFGAAQFGSPILLVHGREDKRVPVRQSRMMADALKAAGKPYEYVEQPLGDHHFTRGEDRLDFLTRMKAFLDRYNPA